MDAKALPACTTRLDGWAIGKAQCRLCRHICVSVHAHDADPDRLECPRCHHHALEIIGWEEA